MATSSSVSPSVSPIPSGYHSVTPYLIVNDAARAVGFYQRAFGATELFRLDSPDGKIGHAEIKIGDSPVMLADEMTDGDYGYRGPQSIGGTPVSLMVYVQDVDRMFAQAIREGAKEQRPVKDQFYGDRSGTLIDPFGHIWTIATHIEDVSPEELDERVKKMMPPAGSD